LPYDAHILFLLACLTRLVVVDIASFLVGDAVHALAVEL
jgi:hypothetical protein